MNKSFAARLAALEALEVQAAATVFDRAPLTAEDRELLYLAISVYSVVLDASGRLVRKREYGDVVALDRALARCNAALVDLRPCLTTLESIDLWIRDLEDPDTFDESELLYWTFYGLAHKPPEAEYSASSNQLSFASGELRAIVSFPGGLRCWWTKIVARVAPILKEREIAIFPLFVEDMRAAIAAIDAGEITCQAPWTQNWKSHNTTIKVPYGSAHHALRDRLVWAFDAYMHQVSGALIETTDELRADLVAALEQFNHDEESIETA